ncbi:MAG: Spy/CpxP family protein refolding chaperone [Candidatus Methylomirabilales bacterium]
MKRIAYQFTYPAACAVAAAALLATIALATPSRAASVDLSQSATAGTVPAHVILAQATSPQAPAATGQAPGPATAPKASRADRVEARITELHTKLGITPAQENLWKNVAQVMRDNAKTMEALTKARSEHAKTMTAVDDLKSYGEISDVHADGIKKFIPVFESLYNSMSDAQKKNADTIFRSHGRTASRKTTSKSK